MQLCLLAVVQPQLPRQSPLKHGLDPFRVQHGLLHHPPDDDTVATTPATTPAKNTSASNKINLNVFIIKIR